MFVITRVEMWRQLREELLNKTIKRKLSKGTNTERRAKEFVSINSKKVSLRTLDRKITLYCSGVRVHGVRPEVIYANAPEVR